MRWRERERAREEGVVLGEGGVGHLLCKYINQVVYHQHQISVSVCVCVREGETLLLQRERGREREKSRKLWSIERRKKTCCCQISTLHNQKQSEYFPPQKVRNAAMDGITFGHASLLCTLLLWAFQGKPLSYFSLLCLNCTRFQ